MERMTHSTSPSLSPLPRLHIKVDIQQFNTARIHFGVGEMCFPAPPPSLSSSSRYCLVLDLDMGVFQLFSEGELRERRFPDKGKRCEISYFVCKVETACMNRTRTCFWMRSRGRRITLRTFSWTPTPRVPSRSGSASFFFSFSFSFLFLFFFFSFSFSFSLFLNTTFSSFSSSLPLTDISPPLIPTSSPAESPLPSSTPPPPPLSYTSPNGRVLRSLKFLSGKSTKASQ